MVSSQEKNQANLYYTTKHLREKLAVHCLRFVRLQICHSCTNQFVNVAIAVALSELQGDFKAAFLSFKFRNDEARQNEFGNGVVNNILHGNGHIVLFGEGKRGINLSLIEFCTKDARVQINAFRFHINRWLVCNNFC